MTGILILLPKGLAGNRNATPPRQGPTQGGGINQVILTQITNTVDVSATSLPLPTGASTETTLGTVSSKLTALTTALGTPLQQSGGSVSITGTIPVSVAALPLPTGAMPASGGSVTIQAPTVSYTHTTVITSTSTGVALAANGSAKYRLFQNLDATDTIFISLSVLAVQNTQIVLFPKTSFSMSLVQGNMDTRVVNCIASANTPKLLVTEGA